MMGKKSLKHVELINGNKLKENIAYLWYRYNDIITMQQK
jgi:hypothetical protein